MDLVITKQFLNLLLDIGYYLWLGYFWIGIGMNYRICRVFSQIFSRTTGDFCSSILLDFIFFSQSLFVSSIPVPFISTAFSFIHITLLNSLFRFVISFIWLFESLIQVRLYCNDLIFFISEKSCLSFFSHDYPQWSLVILSLAFDVTDRLIFRSQDYPQWYKWILHASSIEESNFHMEICF